MILLNALAVYLWRHPGHQPLAGFDAQPRSLNVPAVQNRDCFTVADLSLNPIVGGVIGNLDDLSSVVVRLVLARTRVLDSKLLVLLQPT